MKSKPKKLSLGVNRILVLKMTEILLNTKFCESIGLYFFVLKRTILCRKERNLIWGRIFGVGCYRANIVLF